MSLKFIDAFTFVFKEKNWFVKMLIGAILFFFIKIIALSMDVLHSDAIPRIGELFFNDTMRGAIVLVLLYFAAIILIVLSVWMHATAFGYVVTSIRRYMRAEENILPDWDDVMSKLFRRGFKIFVAIFVYSSALFLFGKGTQFIALAALPVSPFLAMIVVLVALFVIVYAVFIIPALLMSFCEKDRFFSAFDVIRARKLLLMSIGKYVLMEVMLVAVMLITLILSVLLFQAQVGIVILPIVCFYLCIVKGNIISQYYVNYCKEKEQE